MKEKIPPVLSSVLGMKCPKCRKGDLFCNKGAYRINRIFEMPKKCPNCGQDFEIETGFYYGAMYVSYGLTIALIVAIFTALYVLNLYSIEVFLTCIVIALIGGMPFIARLSRAIWLALMIKFDPKTLINE